MINMTKRYLKTSLAATAVLATQLFVSSASANLIPIGPIPTSGAGLGAVNTVVTFQNTGTEVGAVGLLPTSGTTLVTGSRVGFGIPGFPSTAGVTHETAGNAGTNVYSAASLGLISGTASTFSNVVLLFNGNEGGNTADQAITLTNLALNLFNTSGALLGSFTTAEGYSLAATFTGTGTAGYGFQLDATQAAQANAFLLANPTLIIGAAARVTGANGGLETISITTLTGNDPNTPTPGVPDSGGTITLLALGLLCIVGVRHRLQS